MEGQKLEGMNEFVYFGANWRKVWDLTNQFDVLINSFELGSLVLHIQGVPGGMDKTSGECFLC